MNGGTTGSYGPTAGHGAGHGLLDTSRPERYLASRRVTRIGIIVNAALATAQFVLGFAGRSQALVADGVHTLSDIITDLMVLFALKHGAKEADEEHPYGHGRIETAVTVALGALLVAVAIGIALNAGLRLADLDKVPRPSAFTLIAVLATILAKEGLYRYTVLVATRYRSNLLRANAWHHRSDAISSVVVLVGILGSLAGVRWFDGVAAIGVGMMVAKVGWDMGWNAIKELIDTALDAEDVQTIRELILSVDGVKSLHLLRTRRTGGQALVDVHLMVDGRISVSEGHHISETVRALLIDRIESVTDALVHIDPEDDELYAASTGLPLRHAMLERLAAVFDGLLPAEAIQRTTLHYLNGQVHVELLLSASLIPDAGARAALLERCRSATAADPVIGSVHLAYA